MMIGAEIQRTHKMRAVLSDGMIEDSLLAEKVESAAREVDERKARLDHKALRPMFIRILGSWKTHTDHFSVNFPRSVTHVRYVRHQNPGE